MKPGDLMHTAYGAGIVIAVYRTCYGVFIPGAGKHIHVPREVA
jgi:hypothetical protein